MKFACDGVVRGENAIYVVAELYYDIFVIGRVCLDPSEDFGNGILRFFHGRSGRA